VIRPAPAELALGGFCGLLVLVLLYELAAPLGDIEVPSATLARHAAVAANRPFVPPPITSFDAVNERPVFSPLRKPIMARASVDAGGAPVDAIDISLIGIIIDPQRQLALLKTPGLPGAVSLGVGGTIAGWTVSQIRSDRVVIRSGSSEREIRLDTKTPPLAGTTPANSP
jgi:hypothetical protein